MVSHSGRQFNQRSQRWVFGNIRVHDVRHILPLVVLWLQCSGAIKHPDRLGYRLRPPPLTPKSTTYSASTRFSTMHFNLHSLKTNILPGDPCYIRCHRPRPAGVIFNSTWYGKIWLVRSSSYCRYFSTAIYILFSESFFHYSLVLSFDSPLGDIDDTMSCILLHRSSLCLSVG